MKQRSILQLITNITGQHHLKNEEKLTLHAVHLSRNQELILITCYKDLRRVMTWLQSDEALSTQTLLWRSSLDCKWGDRCEFVSWFCRHLVFFLRTFRFTGVHTFYSKNMVWHLVFLLLLKQWNKCSPVSSTVYIPSCVWSRCTWTSWLFLFITWNNEAARRSWCAAIIKKEAIEAAFKTTRGRYVSTPSSSYCRYWKYESLFPKCCSQSEPPAAAVCRWTFSLGHLEENHPTGVANTCKPGRFEGVSVSLKWVGNVVIAWKIHPKLNGNILTCGKKNVNWETFKLKRLICLTSCKEVHNRAQTYRGLILLARKMSHFRLCRAKMGK